MFQTLKGNIKFKEVQNFIRQIAVSNPKREYKILFSIFQFQETKKVSNPKREYKMKHLVVLSKGRLVSNPKREYKIDRRNEQQIAEICFKP